jgi:polygalacturonase
MKSIVSNIVAALLIVSVFISSVASSQQTTTSAFNIRMFGATGNGTTVDSKAINDAIEAAAKAGGGTVYFPAGTYLSYSIRLKSNISLYLDQGCTLLAADSSAGGRYDDPEPGAGNAYQDFGHSHWHTA